jgi:hypothetical protein
MALLLVGYDLNQPGQNYAELWEKLKTLGAWWHHLDSTWLIRTSLTPHEMHDQLASFLDGNDELLIVDISGRSWWSRGFSERGVKWIHDNHIG